MIQMNNLSNIDTSTPEGKMLIAAMSILTSMSIDDLNTHRFGGWSHPHDVLIEVEKIANMVFYEEEYLSEKKLRDRDDNINKILNP